MGGCPHLVNEQAAYLMLTGMAVALLVPVVGVLSSVALLGEKLGRLTMVGGIVVLIGLWLVEHRAPQKELNPRVTEA